MRYEHSDAQRSPHRAIHLMSGDSDIGPFLLDSEFLADRSKQVLIDPLPVGYELFTYPV